MKVSKYFALGATIALGVAPGDSAELSGKVKLSGTPPAEASMDVDPLCAKTRPTPTVTTRHYVVGKDSGLGNVFVYIKEGAAPKAATQEATLLDQVGCEYSPYVMGVVVNQKFKIRNSDPLLHNVHAIPKINKEFNFGQPNKGQVNEKSFDKPEILVRMKCDVHRWMFAYVGVVDHPYFAVTDENGNFTIPNVPAGKYVVEAYHLKAGAKTQEVTLAEADKKPLEFTLEVPAAK